MPVEAPSNCLTATNLRLAEALAASSAFRRMLTDRQLDADLAPQRVFGERVGVPLSGDAYAVDELAELRVFAQVMMADDEPYGLTLSPAGCWEPYGATSITLSQLIRPSDEDPSDAPQHALEVEFSNYLGEILNEIIAWVDENGGPDLRGVSVPSAPGLNNRQNWPSDGKWRGVELVFDWGRRG